MRFKEELQRNISAKDLALARPKKVVAHDLGSRFKTGYRSPRYHPGFTEIENQGVYGPGPGAYEVLGLYNKGTLFGGAKAW